MDILSIVLIIVLPIGGLIIAILAVIPTFHDFLERRRTTFNLLRFAESVKKPVESDWSVRILHPNKPIEKCTIFWNDTPLPWWDPEQPTYQRFIVLSGGGNVRIPKGWEKKDGKITVKDGRKRLASKRFDDLPTVPP